MQTIKQKEWYLKNRELALKRAREWKKNNPDKDKENDRRYRKKHKIELRIKNKKWRKKNPDKILEQGRRYCKKHKEKVKERRIKYCKKNREKINEQRKKLYRKDINASRKKFNYWYNNKYPMELKTKRQEQTLIKHYKRAYGLTMIDLQEMKDKQEQKCLICNKKTDRLHVDHCHKTNQVRGLVCFTCNVGLGNFKDDVVLLNNAIIYLTRFTSHSEKD